MQWLLYGFVVVAGALNAVQTGCNSALNRVLEKPIVAALMVLSVSFSGILAFGLISGQLGLPELARIHRVPWWGWIGGLLGATFLMSMLLFAHRVGAGAFMGLTVTAAIVTSVALDHFGLVGFREHPVGLWRILGCGLMIAGIGLVARY
jgi:bacterial/archaeal transporter family-2 protein